MVVEDLIFLLDRNHAVSEGNSYSSLIQYEDKIAGMYVVFSGAISEKI